MALSITLVRRVLSGFGAALCIASPALAQKVVPGDAPPSTPSDLGFMRRDPSGYVHARLSRDLENGCEYRADVRGFVRDEPRGRTANAYRADLVVQPSLHCPYVPRVVPPARRVELVGADGAALERRLEEFGTVRAVSGAHACEYRPHLRVDNGSIRAEDVSYACRAPWLRDVDRGHALE